MDAKIPWVSQMTVELEEIYNSLNIRYFGGELRKSAIVIDIESRCLTAKGTTKKSESGRESVFVIKMSPSSLQQPINLIVADILHEMIREYCKTHIELPECQCFSGSSGSYHNKKFKKFAESHGLVAIRGKYGWNETGPSKELTKFVDSQGWTTPKLAGIQFLDMDSKMPSSLHRWICPKCGLLGRFTVKRNIRILCEDCNVEFIRYD